MTDDDQDETDTDSDSDSGLGRIEIEWIRCPKCGEKYLTPRQVRAHQSKHSSNFTSSNKSDDAENSSTQETEADADHTE